MNRDKIFEDLIQTIERNAVNNIATISNVELWAKSWREELRQYLVSGSVIHNLCQCGAEIPEDDPYDGYCVDCG